MRQTRDAQTNLFDFYADHPMGQQLRKLSELIDRHPIILSLLEGDFDKKNVRERGARGLSLESIFRSPQANTQCELLQTGFSLSGFADLPDVCTTTPVLLSRKIRPAGDDTSNLPGDLGAD